jgi:hypothetical protein
VNKRDLLRLVIVRDPAGIEPDDLCITTDVEAIGAQTASRYAGRWSIEVCFPRRQAAPRRRRPPILETPWPRTRRLPGPMAARTDLVLVPACPPCGPDLDPTTLAALARTLWSQRIAAMSAHPQHADGITTAHLDTLTYAA